MSDAVIAFNSRGRITFCNASAEKMYGVARSEVLGGALDKLLSARSNPTAPGGNGATPHSTIAPGAAVHVTRDGREIAVWCTIIPPAASRQPTLALIREQRQHETRDDAGLAREVADELRFERLVSELSSHFSRLSEHEVDSSIEAWQKRLVEHLDVERSSFAELTPRGELIVTHVYAAPGVPPPVKRVTNDQFRWLVRELLADRIVLCRGVEDVPEDAVEERLLFTRDGMKSGIAIPLTVGRSLICVLTFGAFRERRDWPPTLISRLQLIGSVFAHAIVRRQAKQRLERKQNELAHFGRVSAMAELASVIAHELDQPLTAVISNAEATRHLIQGDEPDLAEADAALQDVIDAGLRISEIVRRQRKLLRKTELKAELVDLNELIKEIEIFVRAEARRDGGQVTLELAADLPKISVDPIQVQQVILNVARNAIQAMRPLPRAQRQLTIRTLFSDALVEVAVVDTGAAIDDALMDQMFEPFYSTKDNGLGMGLAIGRTIVESHGGRIWPTRNAAQGLTMHIAFAGK